MTAVLAPPRLVLPAGASRPVWLAARRQAVCGSEAATVLGLDPWASPISLWAEKTELVVDDKTSLAMELGTYLEPFVIEKFTEKTGITVTPAAGMLAHPINDWQRVNLDGLIGEDAIYEGKTASAYKDGDWDEDRVPDRTLLQCQHALCVTGRSTAYIASPIGNHRLVIAQVHRDDELIEMLTAAESDFWQHVVDRIPPPVDGHKATADVLGRMWEANPEAVRVLDAREAIPLLSARREAKAAEKAAKEASEAANNGLRLLLGDKEIGVLDGEPAFTWKSHPPVPVAGFTRKAGRTLLVKKAWQ